MLEKMKVRTGMMLVLACFVITLALACGLSWMNAESSVREIEDLNNVAVHQVDPLYEANAALLRARLALGAGLADLQAGAGGRTTEAAADGLIEAGLLARYEGQRAAAERSPAWVDKQMGAVARCIDWLDRNEDWREGPVDVGQIAAGCALGWLAFRLTDHPWRSSHPGLAAWQERFATRPSMVATHPAART